MYEDDPQDRVFDVLGEAVFGDHPLGRAVLGRADVVATRRPTGPAALPRRALRRRPTSSSPPPARSTTTQLVELVAQTTPSGAARTVPRAASRPAPRRARRRRASGARTPSSTTSPSAARAWPRDDERRFALRVLDNILGGTSSSRLFQEVREKRGLAYSVFSFHSLFAGTGQIGALRRHAAGERRARHCRSSATSSSRLRRAGRPTDELKRSKENVKGRIVLSLESTTARMNRLGAEPARRTCRC